jgi:hypothetical protein
MFKLKIPDHGLKALFKRGKADIDVEISGGIAEVNLKKGESIQITFKKKKDEV